MAQSGYTPIKLYYSSTATSVPVTANLADGELAINITDGKLYYKDNAGVVKLLASNAITTPVLSFQTSLGGLTPSTATTGVVTLAGTLNTSSGGSGLTTYTAGDLIYYAAGTLLSKLAIGTNGQVITSSGTAPQYVSQSTLTVGTATNIAGGATGSLPYNTASATTSFLAIGTANQVLTVNTGATAPQYVSQSTLSVGTATNIAGGTANQIPYQSGAGATAFVGTPTDQYVLKYTTSGGIAWAVPSGTTTNALTIGTGLSGTSFNGSVAVTIAIDSTVATLTGTQTLTNKTLTTPVISTISNTGTVTLPTSTDTLVGRATTDTLTNKTLTAPVISTISNTGTVTLPTSTDTLVARATTDTLTNKRIDPRITANVTSGASITPDISTYDNYEYTGLQNNFTVNAPIGTPVDGNKITFRFLDNGTARVITWNATYTAIGVTLPTTTTANKTTYVGCIYSAFNTRWDVIAVATQA